MCQELSRRVLKAALAHIFVSRASHAYIKTYRCPWVVTLHVRLAHHGVEGSSVTHIASALVLNLQSLAANLKAIH